MEKTGYLELFIGPMFSGKTSKLIDIYNNINDKSKVLIINHNLDDRYGKNKIITHDKKEAPCIEMEKLYEIYNLPGGFENYEYILINEGQFFDDLLVMINLLVEKHHKKVYVCGLDGDYKRDPIGDILQLISFCDKVVKLSGKCSSKKCKKKAIFTTRKHFNEDKQILIGGEDIYDSLCRNCFLKQLK